MYEGITMVTKLYKSKIVNRKSSVFPPYPCP